MPSLRRTASSPSVRSSPYQALSSAVNGGLGSRGAGHRRSSGSETTSRRVLADIEWWRVHDGQVDADADQASEDRNRDQGVEALGQTIQELFDTTGLFTGSFGAERSAMVPLVVGSQSSQGLPTAQFAALSIGPYSPRQHSRQASVSSLESTPQAAEPALFEELRLSLPGTDYVFPDATLPVFPVQQRGADVGSALFSLHAHTFNDFASLNNDTAGQYADFTVSPLSSASPHFCN
ncbi:hypothetical protein DXG03_008813 [Asterophora parasitica]|uniref:Uncharacterized protein n=1 Tax=Asterophora parasitica TaxID=117018 RepID=A0A9P7KB73_9AGAR|nr:hypothetical protein DXG03_008813 [Asterophora parasitica]